MVVGVLDGAVRMKRDAARGDSLSVLDMDPTDSEYEKEKNWESAAASEVVCGTWSKLGSE